MITVGEILKRTCRLDPGKDWNMDIIDGIPWFFFHASWSRQDWIRDFQCWTNAFNGRRVHAGYLKEWEDSVNMGLLYEIRCVEGWEVVFSGYSRGAALALMTHDWMSRYCPGISSKAVLVGCPRAYPKNPPHKGVYEVRYGYDLVTVLPPWYAENYPEVHQVIPSTNKWPFQAIKDHGSYGGSSVEIDQEWIKKGVMAHA